MADVIYNAFKEALADGTIDLDNDTFRAILLATAHTPDPTDAVLADLSAQEISGAGYTTNGVALANVTWTRSGAVVTLDADNPQWTAATFAAGHLVIFDDTPAGDPLVCLFDFGGEESVVNGTFTFQFNASGILTLS